MAETSRHSSGMTGHPDAAEMRERYARMVEGRRVEMTEGLVMLTGLYLAISPWVLHFRGTHASVAVNNLVLGIAMAAIGLGLAMFPERSTGLSWMLIPIGVWMIISPWVVSLGHGAPKGIVASNLAVGFLACVLGAAAGAMTMMRRRSPSRPANRATMI